MKTYFELKKELTEAKVSIAKLRPGLKVNVIHTGRSAQNYGVSGQNVYGGRVQVLGLGSVPSGKPAEKRHVLAKDYKDLQQKYKHIWDTDDIKYGNFWNAKNRMKAFFQAIAAESGGKKIPYGHVCWIWKINHFFFSFFFYFCLKTFRLSQIFIRKFIYYFNKKIY